jgi:CHAT domain-containing protein
LKTKNWLNLFVLLFLFLGIFFTSCTQQLSKHSTFPPNIDIENLVGEAFKLYHQGRFAEAAQNLQVATQIVPQGPPSSSSVSLYILLGFFQEKYGSTEKANLTFSIVRGFFQELKKIPPESEALAMKLIQIAWQLKVSDRLQFWERIRPIASASHGKTGEAGVILQIAETYLGLNKYHEAYDHGREALQLAQDSRQLPLEVYAAIVISRSLIGLGRFQEVEGPLQEVLLKTEKNLSLKLLILGARGIIYNAQGRANLAVQDFKEGISLARSLGDANRLAQIQSSLGNVYLSIGKPQESLQVLLEALSHFEKMNDEFNVAKAEGMIAQAYYGTHNFEEANKHALRAAELFRQLGNRIKEAENLRIAGQGLAELNKENEAIETLDKAIIIQVEDVNLDEAKKTFWWKISYLKRLGKTRHIMELLLQALDANARIFRDKRGEAELRSELANVYHELGLFSGALAEQVKVFSLYEELSDKKSQIRILLENASVHAKLGDNNSRLFSLDLAQKMAVNQTDPNLQASLLNAYAAAYEDYGDKIEALQYYLGALELSKKAGKRAQMLRLPIIGEFYRRMGEHIKALEYFEKALSLAKEIGDRVSEGCTLVHIGGIHISMGKFEEVIRISREALGILRATKTEKSYERLALDQIGRALTVQGKYEAAIQIYEERLKLAIESENPSNIKEDYNAIGFVYLHMGKYIEAIEAYKKAIELTEDLRGRIVVERHKMGFFERELSPYEGIVESLYHLYRVDGSDKNKLAEEALYYAELSKARTWMEQFSKARLRFIQETVPSDVRKEEEEILNKASSAHMAYFLASTQYQISEAELDKMEEAWKSAMEKKETVIKELSKNYPLYAVLRYPEVFRLGQLAIREEETLIVYTVGLDWTYAWILKRNRGQNEILKFIRLPVKTYDIEKIIRKFLTPFRNVRYEQFDLTVPIELFKAVLKPAIEEIPPSKRLIIIPDGILNVVPFEALITEVRGGNKGLQTQRFLYEKFYISYYPSATILTINRQMVPQNLPPKGTVLAFGDPVYGPSDERLTPSQVSFLYESERRQEPNIVTLRGKVRKGAKEQGYAFERLKHSGVELQKIKDAFGSRLDSLELLIGVEASEKQVKSKDLTKYQYLHFAVHGILAYDVPYLNEPALVLTADPDGKEDGFLTLSEIYKLNLNSELVTLSACKTGLGLRIAGEGIIGLSRAFMDAGARAVIVSLWEVADHSTALFMEEFYRLLAQGVNKVEALSKAKEYLRQRGYENPFFWSAFILIGD